jgi:hypothetical protein
MTAIDLKLLFSHISKARCGAPDRVCEPAKSPTSPEARDMGHPQIGVILCDPTHSFAAANEWMGHMCVVIS